MTAMENFYLVVEEGRGCDLVLNMGLLGHSVGSFFEEAPELDDDDFESKFEQTVRAHSDSVTVWLLFAFGAQMHPPRP